MEQELFLSMQSWLISWGLPAVWLLAFATGETGIIIAFALSAQGYFSPLSALFLAFLGSLSADLFWYTVTTRTFRPWYEKRYQLQILQKKEQSQGFTNLADRYPYFILTILKFLAGVRLFLTLYILIKQRLPFKKYLFYTIIGNMLFIAVLFPLGWFLGKGTGMFLVLEKKITFFLTILLVLNLSSQFLLRWLQNFGNRFEKKSTKIN